MKRVLTNNIQTGVRGLFGSKQTLEHLQEAMQEVTLAIIKNMTENTTNYFRMYGLVDSDGSATAWNISAGAVYFNGEVYLVDAFVGTHATQVPVLVEEITYRAGDPVKFTDNNEFNTHQIKKLKLQMGVGGSGLVDYSALQELGQGWVTDTRLANKFLKAADGVQLLSKVIEIGDWNMDTTQLKPVLHGLGATQADIEKIRSISVVVRNDSGSIFTPIEAKGNVTALDGGWYILGTNYTEIVLHRITGGSFDNTDYDSTGYNRGWVTIIYQA